MWKHAFPGLVLGLALACSAAGTCSALDKLSDGAFRVRAGQYDDLLTLADHPELAVLVLDEKDPRNVFDTHIKLARTWVEGGGVLWVAGDALEGAVARGIAPFRVTRFDYKRQSTGKRGGEMLIRGASPRLLIHDSALTTNVAQLYLFASSKFDGTASAQPLVEMTDTQGHHGLILTAIPVGRGLLILDGTSRRGHLLHGKQRDFDPAQPNTLKQNGGRASYDWGQLLTNAVAVSRMHD